jgi:hypothetical protein
MAPDTAHRNQLRNRYRTIASWFLCSMQFILAIFHLYPPLAYRSANATTTRVVAWVNSLGGVWVIGLGLTAAFLGISLISWKNLRAYAHLACAAATVAYDVQLWVGALGDIPFGPITYPLSFVLFVVGHLLLFFSYDGGD